MAGQPGACAMGIGDQPTNPIIVELPTLVAAVETVMSPSASQQERASAYQVKSYVKSSYF